MTCLKIDSDQACNISSRCQSLRQRLEINQKELARLMGVTPAYVCILEQGQQTASGPVNRLLEVLETASQVDLDEIGREADHLQMPLALAGMWPEALSVLVERHMKSGREVHPMLFKMAFEADLERPESRRNVARRVRHLRAKRKVSRWHIARSLDVSVSYVTQMERGQRVTLPVLRLLNKLEAEVALQHAPAPGQDTPAGAHDLARASY